MLNIRFNFTIDVKKLSVTLLTSLLLWGQLMTPAHAQPVTPIARVAHAVSNEKSVTVALEYLNVTTTRTAAKKAISSSYSKYFDPQTLAFFMEYSSGAPMAQWRCLNTLWGQESHFNPKALNMSSHALGIAQFLPTTWANYKVKKTESAYLQIKYGLHYIFVRYETPCNALAFHNKYNWY